MSTSKQALGRFGEELVAKKCSCPKCKRTKTFKRLPANFKCADLICDFCGFLAQVKTTTSRTIDAPATILGAAWRPQKERMDSGIYFPLFLVVRCNTQTAAYYLPTDFQSPALFTPRTPLSKTARKAGWQGFRYALAILSRHELVRLF